MAPASPLRLRWRAAALAALLACALLALPASAAKGGSPPTSTDTTGAAGTCDKSTHEVVTDDLECKSTCEEKKLEKEPGTTTDPKTYPTAAGDLCCDCNFKKGATSEDTTPGGEAPTEAPAPKRSPAPKPDAGTGGGREKSPPASSKPDDVTMSPPPAFPPISYEPAPSPEPAPVVIEDSPPPPSPPPLVDSPPPPSPIRTSTLKLIIKVAGAPYPLDAAGQQAVIDSINAVTAPVTYTYRTQQASSPGQLPAVDGARIKNPTVTGGSSPAPDSSSSPAPDSGSSSPPPEDSSSAATPSPDASSGALADPPTSMPDPADLLTGETPAPAPTGDTFSRRRQLLAVAMPEAAAVVVVGAPQPTRRLMQDVCASSKDFVVQTFDECTSQCQSRIEGKGGTSVFPEVNVSPTGSSLCCSCNQKRGDVLSADIQTDSTTSAGENWWPEVPVTPPIEIDGVWVFADAQAAAVQVVPATTALVQASNQGLLCDSIDEKGVNCDGTSIVFQGTGDVTFIRSGASGAAATDSGGGGLSTGAIIGIACGCAAGILIIAVAIYGIASYRRSNYKARAAVQMQRSRTMAAADPDSKWRQMYSARMAEGMRRAEEATSRQKAQSSGPSFLEAQDRAYSQQAANGHSNGNSAAGGGGGGGTGYTPQRSFSKASSFGRGTPATPATELSTRLERESVDHSLMTGSELSSPPPSAASTKGSKRSLKKLFSSK